MVCVCAYKYTYTHLEFNNLLNKKMYQCAWKAYTTTTPLIKIFESVVFLLMTLVLQKMSLINQKVKQNNFVI